MAMEQVEPAAASLSRPAVVSVVAGALGLFAAYAFPIDTFWLAKTPVPAPEVVGSALPFVVPLIAVVSGHLALIKTRRSRLRGRRAAWAGLAFGYAVLVAMAGFELVFWLIVWIRPIAY